jgi:hypothetical protein
MVSGPTHALRITGVTSLWPDWNAIRGLGWVRAGWLPKQKVEIGCIKRMEIKLPRIRQLPLVRAYSLRPGGLAQYSSLASARSASLEGSKLTRKRFNSIADGLTDVSMPRLQMPSLYLDRPEQDESDFHELNTFDSVMRVLTDRLEGASFMLRQAKENTQRTRK